MLSAIKRYTVLMGMWLSYRPEAPIAKYPPVQRSGPAH
jgi:hypothetical protein